MKDCPDHFKEMKLQQNGLFFDIRLQNDFVSKMKKAQSSAYLRLPTIKPPPTQRQETVQQQSDAQQISFLDQWTCQNYQPNKSKIIKALFREEVGKRMKQRQLTESSLVIEAKLFLLRLDGELKKANEINYEAIYKNIEFCSGTYENLFGTLLREIHRLKEALISRYEFLQDNLKEERMLHIKSMEKADEKQNYKIHIPQVRKAIQEKQAQLEPIKNIIEDLEDARLVVLRKCMNQGYDVRQEGLIWVMRELKENFSREDFPKFLNDKQVAYLMGKFQNEQQTTLHKQKQTLLASAPQKTTVQIYNILSQKTKRDFSIAQEAQLIKQQSPKLNSQRHQLITSDVLILAEQELYYTKATKYELIYKETLKKLNKFCTDQIHHRQRRSFAPPISTKRGSVSTIKLISCFDAKVEEYLRRQKESSPPKTQEVALDQILRNLRYQTYQLAQRCTRNSISVVACLVGWKKAKKIIDNEMNSLI